MGPAGGDREGPFVTRQPSERADFHHNLGPDASPKVQEKEARQHQSCTDPSYEVQSQITLPFGACAWQGAGEASVPGRGSIPSLRGGHTHTSTPTDSPPTVCTFLCARA